MGRHLLIVVLCLVGQAHHASAHGGAIEESGRYAAEAGLNFMGRLGDSSFVSGVCRVYDVKVCFAGRTKPRAMPVSLAQAEVLESFTNCENGDTLEVLILPTVYREGGGTVSVGQEGNEPRLKAGDEVALIGARPEEGSFYYHDERLREVVLPSYIGYLVGGYTDEEQFPQLATRTWLPSEKLGHLPPTDGVVDLSRYYSRSYTPDLLTIREIASRCSSLAGELRNERE